MLMKAQRTYFMSLIVLVDWSYVMLKRFTKTPVYIFFHLAYLDQIGLFLYLFAYLFNYL